MKHIKNMKYIIALLLVSLSLYAQDFNKVDENGKKKRVMEGLS
jgi:hypothetical protein